MLEQFHFIRPLWLLAILPLFIVSGLFFKRGVLSRSWKSVIDPVLLPHLLSEDISQKQNRYSVILFFIAALATIFSLAGPAWQKLPQPVFKQESALVIALDLSRSMDANDIKPSRLSRARHKISDLLKLRKEGQTALIAYAASAYTVTPLTDDTETIAALLPSLSSEIMPAQGSRTDIAIQKAIELLSNAGIAHGDILLVTDGIGGAETEDAIKNTTNKGHHVSILAIGTADGAPIAVSDGGFLKDASGSIVIAKLDIQHLQKMSLLGHGKFTLMTTDDSDIQSLQDLMSLDRLSTERLKSKSNASELKTDIWQEQGHWLLLLCIPLAVLIFRKGYLTLLFFLILPLPQPAQAISWDDVWLNDNQRAAQALQKNETKQAAELFNDPAWKGSAEFKDGQFEAAAKNFSSIKTADGYYNQGNALAKSGKLDEAVKAYQKSLDLQPDHIDAKYNKEQIEKQQQQEKKSSEDDNSNKKSDDKQDSDKNSDKDSSEKNKSDKKSSQNQSAQQESDQQKSEQNKSEQNKKESQKNDSDEKQSEQQSSQKKDETKNKDDNKDKPEQQKPEEQADEQPSLSQQAAQQWLRRIPDDPGGLLRNKFKYQYKRQNKHADETQNW